MNSSSKTKLIELNEKIQNSKSDFEFLKGIYHYINYVDVDPLLSKIVLFIKDESLKHSIKIQKQTMEMSSSMRYIFEEEREDKDSDNYPVFSYQELKVACKEFEYIKDYKSEEDLPDEKFEMIEESAFGTLTSTRTKKGLAKMARILYKEHFDTFHKALLRQLSNYEVQGGIYSKFLDYNPEVGVLYFQGKEVLINNRKVTNAHYLLMYLFNHGPFEKHYYDELDDENVLERKSPKSYYDACIDVQDKVKDATGIADFLEHTSGKTMYVRLNPIYSLT